MKNYDGSVTLEPPPAIDPGHSHSIDENVRLKIILLELIDAYGDRGYHGGGLFTRDHQPEPIQKAMDAVAEVMP